MTTIPTSKGDIELLDPTPEMLRNLKELLPFGACQFSEPQNGARYGIVMQCDNDEVWCIKQQPIEVEEKIAHQWMEIQHLVVVDALCRYVKDGFSGAYIVGPYLRQRENGLWEAGVAHFVSPSPRGIEAREFLFQEAFDNQFGHGATTMFTHFAKHFMSAFRESPVTPLRYFGMDVRPRLHLKSFGMYFMALGTHIICLRSNLREKQDPAWTFMAGKGIRQVYHLPSVTVAIQKSELAIAKGAL